MKEEEKILTEGEKERTEKKIGKEFNLDNNLFELRKLRAGLNVLESFDENIAEFGYLELYKLTRLFSSQLERYIEDLDRIIDALIDAGAKDFETPA